MPVPLIAAAVPIIKAAAVKIAMWGPMVWSFAKQFFTRRLSTMVKNVASSTTLKPRVAAILRGSGRAGRKIASLLLTSKGVLLIAVAGACYHFVKKAEKAQLDEFGKLVTSALPKKDAARWWQLVNDEIRAFFSIVSDKEEAEFVELTTLGLLQAVRAEMAAEALDDPQLTDAWQAIMGLSGSLPEEVKEALSRFKSEDILGPVASYVTADSGEDAIAVAKASPGPSREKEMLEAAKGKMVVAPVLNFGAPVSPSEASKLSTSLQGEESSDAAVTPGKETEAPSDVSPESSSAWPYLLAAGGSAAAAAALYSLAKRRKMSDQDIVASYQPSIVPGTSTRSGLPMHVDDTLSLLQDQPFEVLRRSL